MTIGGFIPSTENEEACLESLSLEELERIESKVDESEKNGHVMRRIKF
ncbi:MAG: hypothetical protein Q4F05_06660 [bacterium]|nr:hypothetical protein [bacterium]